MDDHSHILNEPELTSLLGSQVYFEELDLGLNTSLKNSTHGLLIVFNELEGE